MRLSLAYRLRLRLLEYSTNCVFKMSHYNIAFGVGEVAVFLIGLHRDLVLDLGFENSAVGIFLHRHIILNRGGAVLINEDSDVWKFKLINSVDELTRHRHGGIALADIIHNLKTLFGKSGDYFVQEAAPLVIYGAAVACGAVSVEVDFIPDSR